MTLIAPGAKLGPVDLPPPSPAADPREPESVPFPRGRVSKTPVRHRSPMPSRTSSPTRGGDPAHAMPPLLAPKPRTVSSASMTSAAALAATKAHTAGHHAHLSRPGSPSSIHSSGSAIFERDIELPAMASLTLNPTGVNGNALNHKSSRSFHLAHGSTLEQTVPAVLDDAVEALTSSGPLSNGLEIEAPVASTGGPLARTSSAQFSPALRSRVLSMPPACHSASRSPSPDGGFSPASPMSLDQLSAQQMSPISHASSPPPAVASPTASPMVKASSIVPIPTPISPATSSAAPLSSPNASGTTDNSGPTQKHRPEPLRRLSNGPQLPGGWAFTEEDSNGATAVKGIELSEEAGSGNATPIPTALPNHLTPTKERRRISFMSYNDLLLNVPSQVTSLDEITSGNLSPDHLPGAVSPTVPSRQSIIAASLPVNLTAAISKPNPGVGVSRQSTVDSLLAQGGAPVVVEDEWEREGLGKGLEQRLEDLVNANTKPQINPHRQSGTWSSAGV